MEGSNRKKEDNGKKYKVSVPSPILDIDDPIELVYIQHEKASLSKMGERFIEYLIEEVQFDK